MIENEAVYINGLFASGLEIFHLRKPDASIEVLRKLITSIDKIYRNRIAVHQHFELLEEFGLKRIHLNEATRQNITEKQLIEWKENNLFVSTSIHNPESIKSLSEYYTYAFIGPVFPSISKPSYSSQYDLTNVGKQYPNRKVKLIALGGITHENMNQLDGFDGVALLGSIWNNPENSVLEFEKCRQTENMSLQ